jgi:hypothetical protein
MLELAAELVAAIAELEAVKDELRPLNAVVYETRRRLVETYPNMLCRYSDDRVERVVTGWCRGDRRHLWRQLDEANVRARPLRDRRKMLERVVMVIERQLKKKGGGA